MSIGTIRVLLVTLLCIGLASCGQSTTTKDNTESTTPTALPATSDNSADNTGVNDRDRNGATITPGDQPENKADLEMAAKIRQSIVDDKSLSTDAQNVKIVAADGVVTLRGPVKTAREKTAIEDKVKQVAGVSRVENLLEVAAN
jgi:osmotically-inducible protein OsmY